jgi:hypothetical protein
MGRTRFMLSLACLLFLFTSCSSQRVLLLSDPIWEKAFPEDSADFLRGAREAGFAVRKIVLEMKEPHAELFSRLGGSAEPYVLLSPLLGLEAGSLADAFPRKKFLVPGPRPASALPYITLASDRPPALDAMGRAAARYLAAEIAAQDASGQGVDPGAAPVSFAYAVFLEGIEGDADSIAFQAAYAQEAATIGLPPLSLILERVPDDRTIAESLSRSIFIRDVRFLFVSAGAGSKFFISALPARGCIAAGLGIRALSALSPNLAASLEEDYRGLARMALSKTTLARIAQAGLGDGETAPPLRFTPLSALLARRIPYEAPASPSSSAPKK